MMPRRVVLILVAFGIAACNPSQLARTCAEVSASNLRDIIQQPGSPEQVRTQIADRYGLSKDQISVVSPAGMTSFSWSKDGVDGNIGIGGGKPAEGGLHYNSRPPSIAAVTSCLGSPDYYWAQYHSGGIEATWNSLDLFLYFAHQGVLAAAYVHANGKDPPKLNMDLPMTEFRFAPVGSIEDTMTQLTKYDSAEFRKQIKSWPGKLEDVTIQIDPGLTR